jgi:hypothetical protein
MMEADLQIPLLITCFHCLGPAATFLHSGIETSRSDTRGLELLKDWLSPEQFTPMGT